ncbi:MAG: Rpp14/Pop5 family protein [Halodesulfurarchaeum sp.]
MRHLPKHLRPRYRYLAVEIETWPAADLDRSGFQAAAWDAARSLLGDATSAAVDLQVLEADFWNGGGQAIVRIRHDRVSAARAALACVDVVDGYPVRVGVRGVGGTVKATEGKYAGGPPAATSAGERRFRGTEWTAWNRRDRVDLEAEERVAGATPEELEG